MSGIGGPNPHSPHGPTPQPASGEPDPSMEDILASIRRILSEDDTAPPKPAEPGQPEVLALDPGMIVHDPAPDRPTAAEPPRAVAPERIEPTLSPVPPPMTHAPLPPEPVLHVQAAPEPASEPLAIPATLVAPAAAAAAASSLGSLMRTLADRQHTPVVRGGPTIEDLVREEIRPVLKDWLDQHLPGLVERLVRAEIERVVGRATH